jgi:predicted ATPase/DNA-binding SARP family transcriptional activator
VALSYLRQILEPDETDRGKVVIADRSEVRLAQDLLTTDIHEFEEHLLSAGRARDDVERVRHLEAAVEQYQADLLLEFDQFCFVSERQRLADAYQMALRRLVKCHVNQRHFDRALTVAQKAVRADPYREETHRLLMEVYSLLGRPGAAMAQFQELERLLKDRLGTTPTVETHRAMTKCCAGIEALENRPSRPQRIAMAPVSRTSSPLHRAPLHQIPIPLTPLLGREDAVVEVLEMLQTPHTRLVCLKGMPGVGKTRMALAVAEQSRNSGAQVCFVQLDGLEDASEIPTRIATALNLSLRPRNDLWDRLIDTLTHDAPLLILDNIEHLLPKAGRIIENLLQSAPALSCLVTSRCRLGVAGEYGYTVQPLPTPIANAENKEIGDCASVRLWLERVRAIAPENKLAQSSLKEIGHICRSLDGLPLSIELAAAWSDVLTPKQILDRLKERFELLVSRDNPAERRHASLLATLDWSFKELPARCQRFFARLSKFRSGWTYEAAAAVWDRPDAWKLLGLLKERSLIVTRETESEIRYGFLETIHDYASAQLKGEELAETNDRFCNYFVALASAAETELTGANSPLRMQQLRTEEANLQVALALALADDARPELGLRLSMALYRFWYICGATAEGRKWIGAALARTYVTGACRARVINALGGLAYAERDIDAAERYHQECLEIYSEIQDRLGIGMALGNLSNVYRLRNEYRRAHALALRSVRIIRKLDNPRQLSLALGDLSITARNVGNSEMALTFGGQALAQFRLLEDKQNLVTCLLNMSVIALALRRDRQAADYLFEGFEVSTALGADRTLGKLLACAAGLAHASGNCKVSIHLQAAADSMWARLGLRDVPYEHPCARDVLSELRASLGSEQVEQEYAAGLQLSARDSIDLARAFLASIP